MIPIMFNKSIYIKTLILLLVVLFVSACNTNETTQVDQSDETSIPEIVSLTADKTEIPIGADTPSIIKCEAKGGSLTFLWEVDLGEIFPLNEDGSEIRFSGSTCCEGERVITCTVSNDKGNDAEKITIVVLEQ